MSEKTYKTMSTVGGGNIALGIVVLVTGLAAGILIIVSGARLLKRKSEIMFEAGSSLTAFPAVKLTLNH